VIRAVLDTNTIVSGLGWGGPPGDVLDAGLAGHFEIVTSPTQLDELRRVLSYPKLQAVVGDADELIRLLALAAVVVTPTETVTISRDPDDDRLIEAALEADADIIVSGDQDLLTLGRVGHIEILTPREFLEYLPFGHLTRVRQTPSNYARKRL
jgi:putative PIN family toxin of toxin-antitoxin system